MPSSLTDMIGSVRPSSLLAMGIDPLGVVDRASTSVRQRTRKPPVEEPQVSAPNAALLPFWRARNICPRNDRISLKHASSTPAADETIQFGQRRQTCVCCACRARNLNFNQIGAAMFAFRHHDSDLQYSSAISYFAVTSNLCISDTISCVRRLTVTTLPSKSIICSRCSE
jgi:hypothetical protein